MFCRICNPTIVIFFFALKMLILNAVGLQIRPNCILVIRLIRGFSWVLSDFNPDI